MCSSLMVFFIGVKKNKAKFFILKNKLHLLRKLDLMY